MPKVALADSIVDWKLLIGQATPLAEDFPELQKLIAELRAEAKRVEELEELRVRLQAERQVATRKLNESRYNAKYLASRIRWEFKAAYGETHPKLGELGVRPRPSPRDAPLPKDQLERFKRRKPT
jgi:hypothetical protein